MKIILLKSIEKLGKEGDLLEVKSGYGRNYLVPCGLALPATKTNIKKIDELKKQREAQEKKEKGDLVKFKDKIDRLSLTITVEAKEDESLYGAVTEVKIQKLLQEEGVELTKEKIVLKEPINKLGVYKIPIKISNEIESNFRLWVVKK